MALANYSDLKAAITNWMARTDVAGSAEDFITLAEAHLNRELNAVPTQASLNTVGDSRLVDVSGLSVDQMHALFMDVGAGEVKLVRVNEFSTVFENGSRRPSRWYWDGGNITFDAPADAVYPLRLEYDQRFALSDSAPTNDLLTNHPDLYLTGAIVWGAKYTKDPATGQDYRGDLRILLPSVRNHYARRRRSTLKVDDALISSGSYDHINDT